MDVSVLVWRAVVAMFAIRLAVTSLAIGVNPIAFSTQNGHGFIARCSSGLTICHGAQRASP